MALTATISGNSVEVQQNTYHKTDTINGRRTCAFEIYDKTGALSGLAPDGLVGKVVAISNGATVDFAGLVQDQGVRVETGTVGDLVFSFLCSDYSAYADRHVIFKVYAGKTVREIVEDVITFAGNVTETLSGDGVNTTASILDSGGSSTDGPVIELLIVPFWTAAQVFDEVCKRTGFAWLIDYDLVLKLRQAGVAAPFNLGDSTGNFRNLEINTSYADYTNEVWVVRDISLIPPFIEVFDGDGFTTDFFTQKELGQIPTIVRRTSINASAILTFADVAVDGETVTVDGQTYTFRTSPSSADDVATGVSLEESARNLAYAINGASAYEGIFYGFGTVANATCSALPPTADELTVRFTAAGAAGNGTAVSEALTNGSWSAGTLTGGVDGAEAEQTVGVFGQDITGSHEWYWLEATQKIHQDSTGTPLAVGESIQVSYRSIFSNAEVVRDQAEIDARSSVEGTSGLVGSVVQDDTANDSAYAIAIGTAVLRKRKLPKAANYETDDRVEPLGVTLRAGMSQTIDVTVYGVNQSFLIESIDSSDVDGQYIKRQVKAIGFPSGIGEAQGSWVDFLADKFGHSRTSGAGGVDVSSSEGNEFLGVTINGVAVTY